MIEGRMIGGLTASSFCLPSFCLTLLCANFAHGLTNKHLKCAYTQGRETGALMDRPT